MKIGSLNTLGITNQMKLTSQAISKSINRLSTGSRITRPGDDIASFSVGTKLESRIRGLAQAQQNLNQGLGLFSTVEVALEEQIEIVSTIRDLAQQAQDSGLSSSERAALQEQLNDLVTSYNAVTNDTDFNGLKLLNGTQDTMNLAINHMGQMQSLQLQSSVAQDTFQLNVGTGVFETQSSFQIGDASSIDQVELVDLNGNGILDKVTASSDTGEVYISLGKGDGTFEPETGYAIGDITSFQIGDITGDGVLDIVGHDHDGETFRILTGDGSGNFSIGASFSSHSESKLSFQLGDINGNGSLDLVAGSENGDVYIYSGNGDGTFASATTFSTELSGAETIQLADLNGNGIMDLVTYHAFTGEMESLLGAGDGSFVSQGTFVAAVDSGSFKLADLNGSGSLDLIVYGESNDTSIYMGAGNGTFSPSSVLGDAYKAVEFIDFNRDGQMDLALLDGDGNINIYQNVNGTFVFHEQIAGDFNSHFAVGDLNGDGIQSIVGFNSDSNQFEILDQESELVSALNMLQLDSVSNAIKAEEIAEQALGSLQSKIAKNGIHIGSIERWSDQGVLQSLIAEEAYENLLAVDVAEETANLIRNQILQETQVAVLAQANMNAQLVVELLKVS